MVPNLDFGNIQFNTLKRFLMKIQEGGQFFSFFLRLSFLFLISFIIFSGALTKIENCCI